MADVVPGRFAITYCLIDGQLMSMATSIQLEMSSGSPDVKTIALGWAGVTPGSPMTNATIECAMPEEDMEFNPTPKLRTNATIELGVVVSGRQSIAKGILKGWSLKAGVDENTVQSMTGTFRLADFE